MQALELALRGLVVDSSDAAKFAAGMLDRVEGRRIVEAMDAWLDDHGALDADHCKHFEIMLQRRCRRRVFVGRDERKYSGGPKT